MLCLYLCSLAPAQCTPLIHLSLTIDPSNHLHISFPLRFIISASVSTNHISFPFLFVLAFVPLLSVYKIEPPLIIFSLFVNPFQWFFFHVIFYICLLLSALYIFLKMILKISGPLFLNILSSTTFFHCSPDVIPPIPSLYLFHTFILSWKFKALLHALLWGLVISLLLKLFYLVSHRKGRICLILASFRRLHISPILFFLTSGHCIIYFVPWWRQ